MTGEDAVESCLRQTEDGGHRFEEGEFIIVQATVGGGDHEQAIKDILERFHVGFVERMDPLGIIFVTGDILLGQV